MPGESCGQRSLVGYSPQGCKELDTTEQITLSLPDISLMISNVNNQSIYQWNPFPIAEWPLICFSKSHTRSRTLFASLYFPHVSSFLAWMECLGAGNHTTLLGSVSTLAFPMPFSPTTCQTRNMHPKGAELTGQTQVNITHSPRLNLEPPALPPCTLALMFVAIFLA